ncbi:MAG: phosphomethylpyrimidine synthase ThiC [bacterium]
MRTQLEEAVLGRITPAMRQAAAVENVTPEKVRKEIASGRAVLPANPRHRGLKPAVVGRAFRTKVNANLGRSASCSGRSAELKKLRVALDAGADFVMDLSVGTGLADLRRAMIAASPVALGTVPIYEAVARVGGDATKLSADILIDVITEQASQGVDFMTLHSGLLRRHVPLAMKRVMGIVSRGGAILAEWMMAHRMENPLYSRWDDIMAICHRYDVTVSLGDGLRPGCLADASDKAQFGELSVLGKLVRSCRAKGVQVMVEGPGHVPFNQIRMNMEREKKVCSGAPFYVLGPVVTDIAPGYDHITSCIGATAAAYHGASLLCYVTAAEHLALPTEDEVRGGIVAYRIAAHAADVALGLPGARDIDDAMARARMAFDWEGQFKLAIDGKHARERFRKTLSARDMNKDHCSMCGKDFCAMRRTKRLHEASH